MEPYKVRLTITADSEIETRLLEHLAAKRHASMANECRDLLLGGLGRPVPSTPLSDTASRAKKALKFDLSPKNDVDVLAALSSVASRDRHRWLRQRLLAGFASLPMTVDIALDDLPSAAKNSSPSEKVSPDPIAHERGTENEASPAPSRPEGIDNEVEPTFHEDGHRLRPELRGLLE